MDVKQLLKGKNSKLFIAGGVVAVGVVLYEYRKGKLSAATATAVDPNAVTDPYATADTTSGMNYGSDTAGLFSYTDPSTGAVISGGGGSGQVVSGPSTNQQWSQQVQAILIQGGYNATDVQAALGHYIVGTAMTPIQWEIVQAGIALEGPPPQSVPAPNISPSSTSTPATPHIPVNGYYERIPDGWYYQVQNGKLFGLKPATVTQLRRGGVTFTRILPNNPVLALPRGNPATI